jgi:glycosyltransferase involved in cell wall biosynthesis
MDTANVSALVEPENGANRLSVSDLNFGRPLKLAGFSFADGGGGAAKAAYRLHSALRREGADACLYVLRKYSDDPSVLPVAPHSRWDNLTPQLAPRLDQLPLKVLYRRKTSFFSTGWYGSVDPMRLSGVHDADVICMYWVTRGLLGIKQIGGLLAAGKPVVWRLSDMWAFTGGCHYSNGCGRFMQDCGRCPQLASNGSNDLSRCLLKAKLKRWSSGDLTIVAPSRWMAEKAQASRLFQTRSIRVVPTGVDCELFRPIDRAIARHVLNLPSDRPLVLFGATSALSDPRKGGNALTQLFSCLSVDERNGDYTPGLVIFGTGQRPEGIPPPYPVYSMGVIRDEVLLPLVYSACDVFVAPSREENLANSVLEAMACGLPILAYRIGGMVEAVAHEKNGLLVDGEDYEGLAAGLAAILGDRAIRERMATESRARAETQFSLEKQAHSYLDLFAELCQVR